MSESFLPAFIVAPDELTERDQWVLWRYKTRSS
jgi:primase-polymerase (primpol)-like protein